VGVLGRYYCCQSGQNTKVDGIRIDPTVKLVWLTAGGFCIGSDFAWDAAGLIGYRFGL
jgi:hypothetical protein